MMRTGFLALLVTGTIHGACGIRAAADRDQRTQIPAAVPRTVSFAKEVQPLLAARCGTCHLNGKKSGGFRMDSRELFLQGGDSGPVVKAGSSGESPLIRLVAALDPENRMPPQGPILSNDHVGILRAWIDQGLKWEAGVTSLKPPEQLTALEAEAAGLCAVRKVPSKLVYHTTLGEQTYHFCCLDCKKTFVANPAKYGVPDSGKLTSKVSAKPVPSAPTRLNALALARHIDEHINKRLAEKKLTPSPQADDPEFLRRLYLDVHGVIPPVDRLVTFLDAAGADKRLKVVDNLLADARYSRHMADVWDHLLVPRNTPGSEPAVAPLTAYLEQKFHDNVPWDQLVRDILTSSGTQKENGAVTYFLANRTTPMVVDSASRTFLAMPLECAQCHDHPYTRWEQTDYWGFAAFYQGVSRGAIDKFGVIQLNSARGLTEQQSRLEIILPTAAAGREKKKETVERVPARLLGAERLALGKNESVVARPLAAKWLTAAGNPYFARAMVNRLWWQFFGRGLVNPVDDMFKLEAEASHPELLEALSAQFVANGYDVKYMIRAITSSEAYQRTSKPLKGNEKDTQWYSRGPMRVMTPEQIWDSLVSVFGKEPAMPAGKLGRPLLVAQGGLPTTPRGEFIMYFVAEGAAPTEYTQGVPHALRLLNGLQFNNVDALLSRIAPPADNPAKAIEAIYLTVLSRRPTAAEATFMIDYAKRRNDQQATYQDILWVLLKSSEFVMNH
jgi:YHS domain-containing protein